MVLRTRQNRLLPRISSADRLRRSRQVSTASPTSASTRATSAIRFGLLLILAHCCPAGGGTPHRTARHGPSMAQDETAGGCAGPLYSPRTLRPGVPTTCRHTVADHDQSHHQSTTNSSKRPDRWRRRWPMRNSSRTRSPARRPWDSPEHTPRTGALPPLAQRTCPRCRQAGTVPPWPRILARQADRRRWRPGDIFRFSVALSGTTVVAGAPDNGTAYVFVKV